MRFGGVFCVVALIFVGSEFGRVLVDKDAGDVAGLPFHRGARGGVGHARLLRLQR